MADTSKIPVPPKIILGDGTVIPLKIGEVPTLAFTVVDDPDCEVVEATGSHEVAGRMGFQGCLSFVGTLSFELEFTSYEMVAAFNRAWEKAMGLEQFVKEQSNV